jgi:predicted aldo/keto reductase-like oxidoreductase
VRFIGMSGTFPHLQHHIAMGVFDVFQIPYSAVEREHEGGAAKGAPSPEKRIGAQWNRWQQAGLDDLLQEMTPVEFILRFTFSHPDMDTTIVGTVNPVHLEDNLAALRKGPLPPELYTEAKRRLTAAGLRPQTA